MRSLGREFVKILFQRRTYVGWAGLLAVPIPGSQAPSALVLLNDRLRPRRQKALC